MRTRARAPAASNDGAMLALANFRERTGPTRRLEIAKAKLAARKAAEAKREAVAAAAEAKAAAEAAVWTEIDHAVAAGKPRMDSARDCHTERRTALCEICAARQVSIVERLRRWSGRSRRSSGVGVDSGVHARTGTHRYGPQQDHDATSMELDQSDELESDRRHSNRWSWTKWETGLDDESDTSSDQGARLINDGDVDGDEDWHLNRVGEETASEVEEQLQFNERYWQFCEQLERNYPLCSLCRGKIATFVTQNDITVAEGYVSCMSISASEHALGPYVVLQQFPFYIFSLRLLQSLQSPIVGADAPQSCFLPAMACRRR